MIRVLTFLSLAPIIGPEPYGLIALATLLIAPFDLLLVGAGWFEAILRSPVFDRHHQASLYWTHILVGAVAVPLILAGAPVLAYWFGESGLVLILALLATMPLVQGAAIVPRALLARELKFKAIAIVELAATLFGFAVAMPLALFGAGVLSLVALQLVTAWTTILLCIAYTGLPPSPRLRLAEVREFAHVTSRLFGVAVLKLIEQLSLRAVIGSMFGTVALGNYVFARRIMDMILRGALGAVRRVGLAHIGRTGRTQAELVRITTKVAVQGIVLTWPLFILLMVGGAELAAPLVDDDWSGAFPLIAWIAFAGMALPITRALEQSLLGCGRANWVLVAETAGTVMLLCLVAAAIMLDQGLLGIVKAMTLRNALVLVLFAVLAWIGLSRFAAAPAPSAAIDQQLGKHTFGQKYT